MKEKKELSDAEKAEQAEKLRAEYTKKTLDAKLIQDALATNTVLSNQSEYGAENVERARSYYDTFTAGKEFSEEREKEYAKTAEAYKKMDVFGEPSRLSNGDLSAKLIQQFHEATQGATLEELLTGANKIIKASEDKIKQEELPKVLRNYTYKELVKIADKKGAINKDGSVSADKLSNDEHQAFDMYQNLIGLYKEACIERICSSVGKYSKAIKEICDSYKPKTQAEAQDLAQAA
jgi:hypothetical protein